MTTDSDDSNAHQSQSSLRASSDALLLTLIQFHLDRRLSQICKVNLLPAKKKKWCVFKLFIFQGRKQQKAQDMMRKPTILYVLLLSRMSPSLFFSLC